MDKWFMPKPNWRTLASAVGEMIFFEIEAETLKDYDNAVAWLRRRPSLLRIGRLSPKIWVESQQHYHSCGWAEINMTHQPQGLT